MNDTIPETTERVTVEIADHVADVRLSRPDKRNALDMQMFYELVKAGEALAFDRDVRAIVLSGEGKSFCAGIDLRCLSELNSPDGHAQLLERSHGAANLFQRAALIWREMPVPVIAALHGSAFGAGLQIGLAADIRIAAPATSFSIMESRWGIVPDMGGTIVLQALARSDVIRELTYSARIFSAEEALQLGLLTQIAEDPRLVAMTLAREISARSPSAIRAAKRLFNAVTPVGEAALVREAMEQILLLGGRDHREAARANLERRDPRFENG